MVKKVSNYQLFVTEQKTCAYIIESNKETDITLRAKMFSPLSSCLRLLTQPLVAWWKNPPPGCFYHRAGTLCYSSSFCSPCKACWDRVAESGPAGRRAGWRRMCRTPRSLVPLHGIQSGQRRYSPELQNTWQWVLTGTDHVTSRESVIRKCACVLLVPQSLPRHSRRTPDSLVQSDQRRVGSTSW